MKFDIDRDAFAAALKTAGSAVGRPGDQVALSCVLLSVTDDILTVRTTDNSMAITNTVPLTSGDSGEVLLPFAALSKAVSKLDQGMVSVVSEDTQVAIASGKAHLSLSKVDDITTFPRHGLSDVEAHMVNAAAFSAAVAQVAPAASTDGGRPALTGVYLEGGESLQMVATDGYRLAVRSLDAALIAEGSSAIVPASAVAAVAKVCGTDGDIAVRIGPKAVTFTTAKATLWTRLIDAEYPAYRSIMPANPTSTFTVDRSRLAAAVDRATLANPSSIGLSFEDGKVTVTSTGLGSSTEEVEGSFTGDALAVRGNPAYLLDGLSAVGTDQVSLAMSDPLKPIKVSGVSEFTYVYMPLRG